MLPFFTNPYPNELIYSAIARYHFYTGNIDCKDTLQELFCSRSVIPSVEIGSHFSILAEKLGSYYSIETLLANHTIYPYYSLFLSKNRQQEILQDVANDAQGLYTRLGMVAGSICRKDELFYCVECAMEDKHHFGEPYIHREHQLQGIDYCPHHEAPLKKYSVTPNIVSRIEFIRFEIEKMDLACIYEVDSYAEIKIQLAKQAYKLLQQPLHLLSRQEVSLKYRGLLRGLKLVTSSNRVRQKELYEKFKQRMHVDFLAQYESEVNVADEYNWLKVLTRNMKRHVHPFRHLLMLHFLEQDIDDFIDLKADIGPFGKGPFPCLNRSASHYRKLVIPSVEVTRDFKTNAPIGTFKCACGFIYARKGPGESSEDCFRIGRVKQFGHVWQEKLKQLAEGNLSIRAIARRLGILANLERHLDKLQKTERLLSEITESIQQFQIRRCCKVIDLLIIKDEPVILWEVQRVAAVKSHHFHEIKSYLENYLQQKQDVKNDEYTTS